MRWTRRTAPANCVLLQLPGAPEPEVAADAFQEFAKPLTPRFGRAAPKLQRQKLRAWLQSPQTPQERLSLYAVLLGGCGTQATRLLAFSTERKYGALDAAYDGLLGLHPSSAEEGWELAISQLATEINHSKETRCPANATFLHGSRPSRHGRESWKGLAVVLAQHDLATSRRGSRRWKLWDLTPQVLALYARNNTLPRSCSARSCAMRLLARTEKTPAVSCRALQSDAELVQRSPSRWNTRKRSNQIVIFSTTTLHAVEVQAAFLPDGRGEEEGRRKWITAESGRPISSVRRSSASQRIRHAPLSADVGRMEQAPASRADRALQVHRLAVLAERRVV